MLMLKHFDAKNTKRSIKYLFLAILLIYLEVKPFYTNFASHLKLNNQYV